MNCGCIKYLYKCMENLLSRFMENSPDDYKEMKRLETHFVGICVLW